MGNLGLGILVVAVFLVGFMSSWSIRHAFNLSVWFGIGWLGALALLYALDAAGFGYISTAPIGPGGGVALGVGAIVAYVYHQRWKKQQEEKRRREAAARAARRARGEREPTFVGNLARAINKMRSYDG